MAVRTILRKYPYGTGFGGQSPAMPTYGGAFQQMSNASAAQSDVSKGHPYFDWLTQTKKAYGPDTYAEWANTLAAGTSVPPEPPPQGVFPNDPTSPSYRAPGAGAGGGGGGGGPAPVAQPPAATSGQSLSDATQYGGSIIADTGKVVTVNFHGTTLYFDKTSGRQITSAAAQAAGATLVPNAPGAGASGTGQPTTAPGTGQSAAGGGGPTVGQTVSGTTSSGRTVTGQIIASANGTTTVRWDDGTVSTYDSGGNLLSTTPAGGTTPPGTTPPGTTPPGTTPPGIGTTTTTVPPDTTPSGPNALASGTATAVSGAPGLPPAPPPPATPVPTAAPVAAGAPAPGAPAPASALSGSDLNPTNSSAAGTGAAPVTPMANPWSGSEGTPTVAQPGASLPVAPPPPPTGYVPTSGWSGSEGMPAPPQEPSGTPASAVPAFSPTSLEQMLAAALARSGYDPNGPSIDSGMAGLAGSPPPNTNYTIPQNYVVQLPPLYDETGSGAGGPGPYLTQ